MFTFILYNFSERTLKYLKKKLNQSFLYKNFREELVNSGQSFLDFRYQPRQYFNLPKHQYFETNKSYDCDGSFSDLTNLQKNNDLSLKTRTSLEYTCDTNDAKKEVKGEVKIHPEGWKFQPT